MRISTHCICMYNCIGRQQKWYLRYPGSTLAEYNCSYNCYVQIPGTGYNLYPLITAHNTRYNCAAARVPGTGTRVQVVPGTIVPGTWVCAYRYPGTIFSIYWVPGYPGMHTRYPVHSSHLFTVAIESLSQDSQHGNSVLCLWETACAVTFAGMVSLQLTSNRGHSKQIPEDFSSP